MVICEGPDGGGKSTLCRRLSEQFNLPLSAHSNLSKKERNDPNYRSPENVRLRIYQAIHREVDGTQAPEIHDRLFFSEGVYAHVYGRKPTFPFYEERHICRLLMALESPVILCMPPFKELRKKLYVEDEMDGVLEKAAAIYNQYVITAKFMSRNASPKVVPKGPKHQYPQTEFTMPSAYIYNYTKKNDYEKVCGIVSEFLRKRERRTAALVTST